MPTQICTKFAGRFGYVGCQHKYALNLLEDLGMLGCKLSSMHTDPTLHLTKDLGTHLNNPTVYREVIDCVLLDYNEI